MYLTTLKTRQYTFLLTTVLFLCTFIPSTQARIYGGAGTEPAPFIISTAAEMNDIGNNPNDWDDYFILTADIDLSAYTGTQFNIIGNSSTNFSGVFDGNGHTISNFTYSSTGTDYIGLFGVVDGETMEIKDLGLIDCDVNAGTGNKVGALVGHLNYGRITGCYVQDGSVSCSGNYVGGLVGRSAFATIANCGVSCSVSGSGNVGGLVGNTSLGAVANCYSNGSVLGSGDSVGGLAGICASTVSNSYSRSSVSGLNYVGGLAGKRSGIIIDSYSTGSVSGTGLDVGGLVGKQTGGDVENCFWDVNTSGLDSSSGGTGKTTAEMQDVNTFLNAGWDFMGEMTNGPSDDWAEPVGGGYLILGWQFPESSLPPLPTFSGGSGTPNNPYLISTAADLNSIGHNGRLMKAHFKLVNDIYLGGIDFFMIGGPAEPFGGVFDGNGHEVFDFNYIVPFADYLTKSRDIVGLFKVVSGSNALITDLGLRNFKIDAGIGSYVGSLVGRLRTGSVFGCYVDSNSVSGALDTGGLVGKNYGTISNCYANSSVSGLGLYGVGVLVGENGGLIMNCHTAGSILAGNTVGGLVGKNNKDGTISNCISLSMVSGNNNVGGVAGSNGGVVSNSCSVGSVEGSSYVGGLMGQNYEDGIISQCYATSNASGSGNHIGGLVGKNSGNATISNCYATGIALGSGEFSSYVGGLAGDNEDSSITKCYSIGTVSGEWNVGGLVGDNSGTVEYSFWDKQTSGRTNSYGGTGKTTAEMQSKITFTDAGWDFVGETDNGNNDLWRLCADGVEYPKLWWQFLSGDFICPDGVELRDYAILASQWYMDKLPADIDGEDGFVDFFDWVVFAGAWQSTTGSPTWNPKCDIYPAEGDGIVDTNDLRSFVEQWLQLGAYSADIAPEPDGDGVVDMLDLKVFVENWLEGFE